MSIYIPSMGECLEVGRSRGASSRAPGLWRGMRLCLPMQEGGGSVAYDVSGRNKLLTRSGSGPVWSVGSVGRCSRFAIANADLFSVAGTSVPHMQALPMTHVCWVYPTAAGPASWSGFAGMTNNSSQGWHWGLQSGTTKPWVGVYKSNGSSLSLEPAISLPMNAWSMVAFRYDGVNLSLTMSGSTSLGASANGGGINVSTNTLFIGSRYNGSEYCFSGNMCNYNALNAYLSNSQLDQLYARPWDHLTYVPRLFPAATAAAPLTLADDSFSNTEPFDNDEEIGTVAATGGTAPYSYEIISQTLV